MEDQVEEASGTSVEPQPESHVQAVSTKGKGKGKGRGRKRQPSNNESVVNAIYFPYASQIVFTCKFRRKGLLNILFFVEYHNGTL